MTEFLIHHWNVCQVKATSAKTSFDFPIHKADQQTVRRIRLVKCFMVASGGLPDNYRVRFQGIGTSTLTGVGNDSEPGCHVIIDPTNPYQVPQDLLRHFSGETQFINLLRVNVEWLNASGVWEDFTAYEKLFIVLEVEALLPGLRTKTT